MFWNNFVSLCNNSGKSPNAVAKELSLSSGSVTSWKNGRVPHHSTLLKIAAFFNVTVDYLIGEASFSAPAPKLEPKAGTAFFLTAHEAEVMTAYRNQPDMQPAVDRILGVTDNGVIVLSQAAKSAEHRKPGYEQKPVEKWTAIENAPETDDDLL